MLLLFWSGLDTGDGRNSLITYYIIVTGENGDLYSITVDPDRDIEYTQTIRPSPATYSFTPVGRIIP